MEQNSVTMLEDWLPQWAHTLAETLAGGAGQMFIVHGNVNDILRVEKDADTQYTMLAEFLATQIFGRWDAVIYYDQVRGPRALASNQARLNKINQHIERFIGTVEELRNTREPWKVLAVLDRYLEMILLREGETASVAILLDYAHFIAPSTAVSHTSREMASNLATLLNWAKSPYFKKVSFAFCLISERLSDLHVNLVQNPHTTKIEVPYPEKEERRKFLEWSAGGRNFTELCEIEAPFLAELTAGLTLVQLQGLMRMAVRGNKRITMEQMKIFKKNKIEGQCEGLVEFIEPKHTLDMVVGQEAAKKRLKEDSELIHRGRLDAVPMGYLFCGPVGTGKSFLAECYSGSVGVPCLKLLNFRSKYVGETEGNLEKILKVLRVMGPVAVIIDEADAMLGDRQSEGDSGTSSRVFGTFAAQMGNTAYRGKIIWFLLTSRPDLLPIDLKRQGRCEVHIPLFYPETQAEYIDMFVVMGKKAKVDIKPDEVPEVPSDKKLSGADIEGIVTRAQRISIIEGASDVAKSHLQTALDGFVPSAESDEKLLQALAATVECTDIDFLPDHLKREFATPDGRIAMLKKMRELKMSID